MTDRSCQNCLHYEPAKFPGGKHLCGRTGNSALWERAATLENDSQHGLTCSLVGRFFKHKIQSGAA